MSITKRLVFLWTGRMNLYDEKYSYTNLKTKCDVQPNQNVNNLHLLVQNEM